MEKHQITIPNGRIVIKQERKVKTGPMNMFVDSEDENLLQFAIELSREATEGCMEYAKKENFKAQSKKKRMR